MELPLSRPEAIDDPGDARLTIVVPTLNERAAIGALLDEIRSALAGVAWRVLVVDDDSRDGTAEVVKAIGLRDPRVACLRRVGRRGLSGAVVEGALAASTPYLAVIDGDGQHPPGIIAELIEHEGADLAVASRFAALASVCTALLLRERGAPWWAAGGAGAAVGAGWNYLSTLLLVW